jgi:hypothetical protein
VNNSEFIKLTTAISETGKIYLKEFLRKKEEAELSSTGSLQKRSLCCKLAAEVPHILSKKKKKSLKISHDSFAEGK